MKFRIKLIQRDGWHRYIVSIGKKQIKTCDPFQAAILMSGVGAKIFATEQAARKAMEPWITANGELVPALARAGYVGYEIA